MSLADWPIFLAPSAWMDPAAITSAHGRRGPPPTPAAACCPLCSGLPPRPPPPLVCAPQTAARRRRFHAAPAGVAPTRRMECRRGRCTHRIHCDGARAVGWLHHPVRAALRCGRAARRRGCARTRAVRVRSAATSHGGGDTLFYLSRAPAECGAPLSCVSSLAHTACRV